MTGFYIYYVLCMPTDTLLRRMCVYYSNCITIMSDICDSIDTGTCTY